MLWSDCRCDRLINPSSVFAKTVGLSDKTGKFLKYPANFSVCRTVYPTKNYNPEKCPDSILGDFVFNGSKLDMFPVFFDYFPSNLTVFTELGKTSI